MTSRAQKLFDEVDSLQVKLRSLREMRNDLLEQTLRLDFEIGQTRLLLRSKCDEFKQATESVAEIGPRADADPQAHVLSMSPAGGSLHPLFEEILAPFTGKLS